MKLVLVGLLAAAMMPAQSVVISQIYGGGGNTGATWRNDFVELFNRGAAPASLAGWSVQYASATGTTWQVAALDGTIEPGQYFLIQLAAGTGGTQALPTPDATGTLALGAAAGKIALVRNATPLNEAANRPFVQDLVGYGSTANDFRGAGPTRDLSNTTAAIRGGAGCIDTSNNAADFTVGTPTPRNRATARNDCSAVPEPAQRLRISEIQGSGAVSPYVGKTVVTRGVVYARRTNGYYIQSLREEWDNDDATSEGLLVFTSTAPPAAIVPGAVVDVEGVVTEFRPAADPASPPLTELTSPVATVLRTGEPLPEPEWLRGTDWERWEGMRVQAYVTVTGPTGGTLNETRGDSTSNGVFWAVLEGPRPFRRPGLTGDDTTGQVRVDTRALGGNGADLAPGDTASLSGPLDFGFRTYTILRDGMLAFTSPPSLRPVPAAATGEFTVATLNLQRFFDAQTAFPTRLAKLKLYIRDVLRSPDILAVQEAGTPEALDKLAAELGGYRALRGATADPSGIAPGYLVKTATVTILTAAPYAIEARFGDDNQLIHDRPPYRIDVRIRGQQFVLLCVHVRSLTDITDARVQAKRKAQAESINILARGIAAENLPFAILGDFNSFPFDDGYADMLRLIGNGLNLTNLHSLLADGDNHSYVFNGATQALDHILVSPAMRAWLTRAAYAGGNADSPESLRADAASPARVSDHDAAVAWFRLDAAPLTPLGVVNAASFRTGSIAPGEVISLFGRGLTGTRVTIDGQQATAVIQTPGQWNVLVPAGIRTSGTVELAMDRVGSVELPVAPAAPGLFATQPAGRRGDIVELWGTGAGAELPTFARMCGVPAEVVYSGTNAGLWQVNVRIPATCPVGPNTVEVASGARTAPEIAITVR